ncbi:MAG: cysteine desulfurase [Clostridiales Family XIII bacterium]|jgi:cysteine desulfurase|nr:cysteine desulfurase [Clostridiales Family XIII bacterium]
MIVYLDNASTTKPSEAAIDASLDASASLYGNPSSTHTMGQDAERVIKEARCAVAESIGARPEHLVFTGSGTEADNLALRAVCRDPGRASGSAIFISSVEHPAVREPATYMSELGVNLTIVSTDGYGMVDCTELEDSLEAALERGDVRRAIISVMHVNNELGTIQPVAEIARIRSRISEKTGTDILFHTDAVQSYLKLPMDVRSASGAGGFAGVDLISFSAHKVHGPKGVGALYASCPEKLVPIVRGGGQEGGLRAGTENVPGIAGFGAAAVSFKDINEGHGQESEGKRVALLRDRLLKGIENSIPDVRVNSPEKASPEGEAGGCSPYILNVSFIGTRGEVVLRDLEQRGVFVSTGSACSNIGMGVKKMNTVLAATGLTPEEAEGAIRFSLSGYNTYDEIDYAIEQVTAAVARFRRIGSLR